MHAGCGPALFHQIFLLIDCAQCNRNRSHPEWSVGTGTVSHLAQYLVDHFSGRNWLFPARHGSGCKGPLSFVTRHERSATSAITEVEHQSACAVMRTSHDCRRIVYVQQCTHRIKLPCFSASLKHAARDHTHTQFCKRTSLRWWQHPCIAQLFAGIRLYTPTHASVSWDWQGNSATLVPMSPTGSDNCLDGRLSQSPQQPLSKRQTRWCSNELSHINMQASAVQGPQQERVRKGQLQKLHGPKTGLLQGPGWSLLDVTCPGHIISRKQRPEQVA